MNKYFTLLFFICSTLALSQNRIKPSDEYVQHLNAAKSHKTGLIKTKKELNKLSDQGKLVQVKQRGYGYRIAKLTHSHAYLVPKAKNVLDQIAREFVVKTGQNFFVVTSMTRTESDQNRLRSVNTNASSNDSSHSYGSAIDISYVRFNNKLGNNAKLEKQLEAVLTNFQKQGKIYFVKEKNMKCFHIIIRNY